MLLFLLIALVVGFVAYKMRVQVLAKILGQSESRVRGRLDGRK